MSQVVALGEIGLDYSLKNGVDHWLQKRVFAAQLQIAIDAKLPVCLHVREATQDAFEGNTHFRMTNGKVIRQQFTEIQEHVECLAGTPAR